MKKIEEEVKKGIPKVDKRRKSFTKLPSMNTKFEKSRPKELRQKEKDSIDEEEMNKSFMVDTDRSNAKEAFKEKVVKEAAE